MRLALLVVCACSFEHGTAPRLDAPIVADAPGDNGRGDARVCPAAPAGCTAFGCAGSSSCYFACGTNVQKVNQATATSECMNAGGCLVTVDNLAERMCLDTATHPSSSSPVWIGLVQTGGPEPAGGWTWACGMSSYEAWAFTEPNNIGGNEDCAAMVDTGLWVDGNCNSTLRYVCEIP